MPTDGMRIGVELGTVAALAALLWAALRRRVNQRLRIQLVASLAALLSILLVTLQYRRRILNKNVFSSELEAEVVTPSAAAAKAEPPPAARDLELSRHTTPDFHSSSLVEDTNSDVTATKIEEKGAGPVTRKFNLTAAINSAPDGTFEEAAEPLMEVVPGLAKTIVRCRELVEANKGAFPIELADDLACALVQEHQLIAVDDR
jgi:hypothetical protein